VDEHVLSAIVTDDETEALLRIEEFDDAFAFADDLRRHSATTATTKTAASAASAAETAAASAAIAAAAVAVATASAIAAARPITEAAAAAKAAALLVTTAEFLEIVFAETFALVAAATAAIPLAPSIETHEPSELKPAYPKNQRARAKRRNRSWRESTHAPFRPLHEK
jgi:hypothetical protein